MAPSRPRSLRTLAFGSNATPRQGPPSPTFSETTNVSAMNFGTNGPQKIITRANLKASLQSYEDLMNSCANYRHALITMSTATAAFADAMETCSGLKGPSYETGTRLQAASGLHHLIGNHWHVLAETLDKNFEKPLRQHLENYRTIVTERSASYERALREKSQIIRDTEMKNMNKKERNLQSFREALTVLQRQVDELDDLKAEHYQEIIEHEEEVWDVVSGKVSLVVRSTMDVFDRFTAKASDPVIEPMLQSIPDPFDSYGPPQAEDQIFSILPPLSIMTSTPSSSSHTPVMGTPTMESAEVLPATINTNATQSWIDAIPPHSPEWADAPSSSYSSPSSRAVSPTPAGTSVTRRHSSPVIISPVGSPNSRKPDPSKLRSVLNAIDESPSSSTSSSSSTANRDGGGGGGGGGGTLKAKKPKRISTTPSLVSSSFSWASPFSYGQSPYSAGGEETDESVTPRGASFHSPTPPSPAVEKDREREDLNGDGGGDKEHEQILTIPIAS